MKVTTIVLESLKDIQREEIILQDMIYLWEYHEDPCSDPGLQYEQENKIKQLLIDFKDLVNNLIRDDGY